MPAPVVVSNRGPLGFARDAAGALVPRRGAGGLVVTLGPGVQRDAAVWVAGALSDADREAAAGADGSGVLEGGGWRWRPVVVDPADYGAYYDVVANGALWYCVHGLWDLPRRPRFDRHWREAWAAYRSVNAAFADAVAEVAEAGAPVLLHDYHLALVGEMLAARRPDLLTALFLHTPWCSPSELAVLPDDVAAELLTGMAGAGAVGFHSPRWAAAFSACCEQVLAGGRAPATFVAPAATDAGDLRRTAASEGCSRELAELDRLVGERQFIVRVDRIELSKNILRGFWAFDELLESREDLRGRVVFGAFVYPSREALTDYAAYGAEVRTVVGLLNAKWGDETWTPVLLDPTDNYDRSVAALRRYDVLLVNPIRDGLNLVAQEGPLVNERSGSVLLSRQAGAWDTLGDHVLGVNPFDVTATAAAMAAALDRSAGERAEAASALRAAVEGHSPLEWWDRLAGAARGGGGA